MEKSMLFFWVVMLYWLVSRYHCSPEEGESMFLWNLGTYLQIHRMLQPRRILTSNVMNMVTEQPSKTRLPYSKSGSEVKYHLRIYVILLCWSFVTQIWKPVTDECEALRDWPLAGENCQSTQRKPCPTASLSTINLIWIVLGLHYERQSEVIYL
jgi:hypothetical protein